MIFFAFNVVSVKVNALRQKRVKHQHIQSDWDSFPYDNMTSFKFLFCMTDISNWYLP